MKKIIYCLLPLFAFQLNSCAPGKYFSREVLTKDPEDPTIVTGFKNRIGYLNATLDNITCNTYNDSNGLVVGSRYAEINTGGIASTNGFTEYEYDKNGLLISEKTLLTIKKEIFLRK